ncbi:MAG: twin-arginine translocase TatA/TatE family subunit [Candidatus Omnitrophica bacterium]|nr:twin-arginine translocase TatA/TatE family subunit [Candidatus Omnitrophota bacterium]MCM8826557.1 twin-arginine translocase TatA/TatE family subunit [Candidatus Omnitrophota bacterium]
MGRIGFSELIVILLILLLLFGASRLPQIARALGESIKEFKKGLSGKKNEEESNHQK